MKSILTRKENAILLNTIDPKKIAEKWKNDLAIDVGEKFKNLQKINYWHIGKVIKYDKTLSSIEIKPLYSSIIKIFKIHIESENICDLFTHVKLNKTAKKIVERNLCFCNNYENTKKVNLIAYKYSIGHYSRNLDVDKNIRENVLLI